MFAESSTTSRLRAAAICVTAFAVASGSRAQNLPAPIVQATSTVDGLTANISNNERLSITICSPTIIHVVAHPSSITGATHPQPWLLDHSQSCPGAAFQFAQTATAATLTTTALKVSVNLRHGNVAIATLDNHSLLRETSNEPRTYDSVNLNGDHTFHLADRFSPDNEEGFYGLGQHQSGLFNYRGSTVELAQNNTDVAIPLLLSSRGYAVLWNTASISSFDNRFPREFKLSALAGDSIDYFLVYGPEFDSIVHQYRTMTGHVPLFPKWAYGFFQSKDRYSSQQQILDIAAQYRKLHIPMDAIVQDWFWWQHQGDPVFNKQYTDVPAELAQLHSEHVHAMISVWAKFDTSAANYATMVAQHFDISPAQVYDPTNPAARDFFWNALAGKVFAQGWDAFWLDSSEPEEAYPHSGDAILANKQLTIGNGALYTNVYPLEHTENVSNQWQHTTDQKRVFLLTRSAFLGQQRVGATTWSGDIVSTFWSLQHQIPAGLNFALSGNPYWTTDTGGYYQPFDRPPTDPDFQQLYARWFEFSAFCPIFRTHGHRDNNEIWTYDKVEPILLNFDKLRYRMMPYIYSLAWRVTSADDTIQRPLIMDWRTDPRTWNLGDEYMFGPAILVAPITQADVSHRSVYLPASPRWYDFWTGR
ncbi:MAG: glycoside hydrolase family 31 protein, partial [Acidobacteriota bacterium]